jgi:hypothetical protein
MEASGPEEPRNWTARVLAPVALAAVVAAAFLVINGSVGDDDGDNGDRGGQTAESEDGCNPEADQALEDGFYIMKPDEPGLSAVEDRTCMSVDELSALNPDLDPQLISVGQCINLREDGCEDSG